MSWSVASAAFTDVMLVMKTEVTIMALAALVYLAFRGLRKPLHAKQPVGGTATGSCGQVPRARRKLDSAELDGVDATQGRSCCLVASQVAFDSAAGKAAGVERSGDLPLARVAAAGERLRQSLASTVAAAVQFGRQLHGAKKALVCSELLCLGASISAVALAIFLPAEEEDTAYSRCGFYSACLSVFVAGGLANFQTFFGIPML
eukprot:TRINITY_DN94249_c0_g1_i1.p1 TRINITY_DN94249_c0_g1~~TRINITY_DN94249_c0_g1_i1.p1  ORF type:complete len:204 (-),score=47.92 TRINITY_DN94249_c0_g1_i1:70-681(-)